MCEPGTGPLSQVGRAITQQNEDAGITDPACPVHGTPVEDFKDKICDCGKSAVEKCDNSCRMSEIEAQGTVGDYLNFLGGDEEDPEDLSEIADSVSSFVDAQIKGRSGG